MTKLISSLFCAFSIIFALNANALETNARYAIVIDAQTHETLFEKNAFERMAPSSMSKMLTAYVVFDYLKKGKLKLDQLVTHSEKAWRQEGSRMFVPLGTSVTIGELLKGLIIPSGNDAAVSLAEASAGTEQDFANVMNEYGKLLGLKNSHFTNSTGLPNKDHYSTAYDLAIIAERTISDFPEYYKYYAEIDFEYNNIKQQNRNTLLYSYQGADGLKTGHADEAGFGITFSAIKDGRRLIGVVNGLPSIKQRSIESAQLLNYGFMNFTNLKIAEMDQQIKDIKVLYGKEKKVSAVSGQNVLISVTNLDKDHVKVKISYNSPIIAPVRKGDEIGKIIVKEGDKEEKVFPLLAARSIEKANIFQRISQNISYSLFD